MIIQKCRYFFVFVIKIYLKKWVAVALAVDIMMVFDDTLNLTIFPIKFLQMNIYIINTFIYFM